MHSPLAPTPLPSVVVLGLHVHQPFNIARPYDLKKMHMELYLVQASAMYTGSGKSDKRICDRSPDGESVAMTSAPQGIYRSLHDV